MRTNMGEMFRLLGCCVIVCAAQSTLAEDVTQAVKQSASAVTTTAAEAASTEVGEQSVQLKYKFQPGQFVYYEVSDHVRYVTQQGGRAFETFQRNESSKHYRVVSVDEDGTSLLEPIIDRVKMLAGKKDAADPDSPKDAEGNQSVIEFDSSHDKVAPPEFRRHQETLGKALARFQFSAHGELRAVRVTSDDIPAAVAAAAAKADPKLSFLIPLPTESVVVGHRWKQKYDEPISVGQGLTQQIPMLRQFELTAIKDGIATIKFKTSILALLNDPKIQGQLAQQTPAGFIEFDIERGLIRSRKSTSKETVVNAFGQQTLLQVVGESIETFVPNTKAIEQVGFTREADAPGK